jgi:hypothetical protein
LDVPDLSADNNDTWLVPWKEAVRGDDSAKKKEKKESRPTGTVALLGTPEMWIQGGDWGWAMFTGLVTGGRSSRRLQEMTLQLEGDGTSVPLKVNADRVPPIWISIPDVRRRVVPAKAMIWFPLDEDLCTALAADSFSPTTLQITLGGPDVEAIDRSYPLEPGFSTQLVEYCRTTLSAGP